MCLRRPVFREIAFRMELMWFLEEMWKRRRVMFKCKREEEEEEEVSHVDTSYTINSFASLSWVGAMNTRDACWENCKTITPDFDLVCSLWTVNTYFNPLLIYFYIVLNCQIKQFVQIFFFNIYYAEDGFEVAWRRKIDKEWPKELLTDDNHQSHRPQIKQSCALMRTQKQKYSLQSQLQCTPVSSQSHRISCTKSIENTLDSCFLLILCRVIVLITITKQREDWNIKLRLRGGAFFASNKCFTCHM